MDSEYCTCGHWKEDHLGAWCAGDMYAMALCPCKGFEKEAEDDLQGDQL